MLILKNDTFGTLCSHAENTYPRECCGILLGRKENGQRIAYRAMWLENVADDKQTSSHFLINPLEIYKAEVAAEQERLEIVGFYHSHPDCEATASQEDEFHMIAGLSYPIVSLQNGTCVAVKSFEKIFQADTAVKEEILIKE